MRSIVTDLISASGYQDHTPSPSACKRVRLLARQASIASRPNVRDDREAPLVSERDGCDIVLIWVAREGIYFFARDWTGSITLIGLGELPGRRRPLWSPRDQFPLLLPLQNTPQARALLSLRKQAVRLHLLDEVADIIQPSLAALWYGDRKVFLAPSAVQHP